MVVSAPLSKDCRAKLRASTLASSGTPLVVVGLIGDVGEVGEVGDSSDSRTSLSSFGNPTPPVPTAPTDHRRGDSGVNVRAEAADGLLSTSETVPDSTSKGMGPRGLDGRARIWSGSVL